MAEAQFTPEVAKQAVAVVANPEAAITGTSNPILDAARVRYSAGQSEDSLKVISGEVVPYTEKDVERVLLWNLSSERDPATGEKKNPTNANEDQRFRDSKMLAESARKFIENGHIDATLRTPLINFLTRNSPAVADIIAGIQAAGANVDNFVDGLMKTPGFRENLRTLFIERLNPTKRLTQEQAVKNLELDIANLQAQLGIEVTQAQIDAARTELDIAKAALTPHTGELLQLQSKTVRYQELTNEMSEIKREMRKYEGQGKPLETQRNTLLTEKGTLNPTVPADATRIAAIDAEIKNIEKNQAYANYTTRKAEIAEHTGLTSEIATLQIALEPFQHEITKKQDSLNALLEKQKSNITPQKKAELEAQINKKKGDLADARTLLEAEMIKFYQEVTHMGQDAMEKHLNGAFSKVKAMWKEEADKQATKDTTEEGKRAALAIDKVTNLWKTKTTKGGLTFYKPDKNKAKTILDEAFKAGGGENIAVYLETKTATDLGITPEEHAALKEKLKDPEFRKAQSEGLAKQALADYLIAGGRMNGDLVKSLATTDFGKALLTEARAKADTAMQQYKDQFGKGVLDGGTKFSEFVKGNWWKFGIGIIILLILLGIISVAK